MSALISKVKPHSLAENAGITKDEELITVNNFPIKDIIELSYLQCDECVNLQLKKNSKLHTVKIIKHPDQDLGLEFNSAVFDEVRTCQNKCIFCFVDQMIPGMRKSLYVRDDDYRLSFLYGNFLTLTNMQDVDFDKILRMHLSPLYVSVHSTDANVRKQLMNNKFAGEILQKLHFLIDNGIEIHTQIVCCPDYNDGKILERTFQCLYSLYPGIQSVAIVPVGLTKNRAKLTKLRTFTKLEALQICKKVSKWQKQCLNKFGKNFVYLADEFYLLAGISLPIKEAYDNFPQFENGIGLSRIFIDEWNNNIGYFEKFKSSDTNVIPVGEAAYSVLKPLLYRFNKKINGYHQFISVKNKFFGGNVNVTGLLTAQDILRATQQYNRIILPKVIMNDDNLFLDGISFDEFKNRFDGEVKIAQNAKELLQLLVER